MKHGKADGHWGTTFILLSSMALGSVFFFGHALGGGVKQKELILCMAWRLGLSTFTGLHSWHMCGGTCQASSRVGLDELGGGRAGICYVLD